MATEDEPISPRPARRGEVVRASGRTVLGDKSAGQPRISEIELRHDDGTTVSGRVRPAAATEGSPTASAIRVIPGGTFPYCPICLREDVPADSAEHIPPTAFGGQVMANTCTECNNKLGSRTEAAMQDWLDMRADIHFTSPIDPKPFGRTKAVFLTTEDGKSIVWFENSSERSSLERLSDPDVSMHYKTPRSEEYLTGVLKSVYLAACLLFGGVPDTPSVASARVELLAARDAKRRADVQLGSIAGRLSCTFIRPRVDAPPLVLAVDDDSESPRFFIALGGCLLVAWPFADLDPRLSKESRPWS